MARDSGKSDRRLRIRRLRPSQLAMLALCLLIVSRVLLLRSTSFPSVALPAHSWNSITARVGRVIDGDTVELTDTRRVRLLGIDAPEISYDSTASDFFADESKSWLREQVDGKEVILQTGMPKTDKYGRMLSWIYLPDGTSINVQSVRSGMAKVLADFGLPEEIEPELRRAEAEARVRKLGIWSGRRR
ncbi:MAG: thermonuclease family protein [Planctomycetaceae bacterium]